MVVCCLLNATIGVNILILKPLSPQLMPPSSEEELTGFTPLLLMMSTSSLNSIVAPSFCIMSNAALSSLLMPGLWMMDFPFLTKAAAHARCMELLDAAAKMFPDNVDGCMVTFMPLSPKGEL